VSESDRVAVIIPARYGSTRLPGKPLAVIAGKTMLERVWRIAASLKNVGRILIATDDERLVSEANRFGAQAVMTGECENGTERALVALERISEKFDVVVNFQGDAVLTPPWILQALIDEMLRDSEVQIATPAVRLNAEKYRQLAEAK
jgi:3-deoxy-manno-octulosonate cytidylyltransferase (CMP-KDO synthetase)